MKLRLNRNNKQAIRVLLAGSFAFFLIKGLVWIALGAIAAKAII